MHGIPFWFAFILQYPLEILIGLLLILTGGIYGIVVWLKNRSKR